MKKINVLDCTLFIELVINGLKDLKLNSKTINELNVFPVPDGDTGSNMTITLSNGVKYIKNTETSISELSANLARGMLLGARGNSGVILSQFFKGLSLGLEGKVRVNALELTSALICAYKEAYQAVVNPTEGTMLTVFREAIELIKDKVTIDTSIDELLEMYYAQAKISLSDTINRLPILKEAGVIDSGGAGFVAIIDGMIKYLSGETLTDIDLNLSSSNSSDSTDISFNENSELEYGYCTEFILQLQTRKINASPFVLSDFIDYLKQYGDSIVATQDGTLVKVHVHTKTPAYVISKAQEYGEFINFKMENMTLQHNEVIASKHKDIAYVAVINGEGVKNLYKELGCDVVIYGGQTMNVSTEEFINAFKSLNADHIIVLPNNKNIILAANQAKSMYDKCDIRIIPTTSITQGYFALSTNVSDDDIETQVNNMMYGMSNVDTIDTTYAIRDTTIEGIVCKKGDYISMLDSTLVSSHENKIDSTLAAINQIEDILNKEILVVFKGKDASDEDVNKLTEIINEKYPNMEVGIIDGEQDIYPFILGVS